MKDFFSGIIGIAFMLAYGLGGIVGAIYWAIQENLLYVVLSIFIPLFGAITVIHDYFF
jgi:uncharacterized membrane protein